jgi:hypothetical protein
MGVPTVIPIHFWDFPIETIDGYPTWFTWPGHVPKAQDPVLRQIRTGGAMKQLVDHVLKLQEVLTSPSALRKDRSKKIWGKIEE